MKSATQRAPIVLEPLAVLDVDLEAPQPAEAIPKTVHTFDDPDADIFEEDIHL